MSPGKTEVKRRVHSLPAATGAVPRGPTPSPVDDGLRSLAALLGDLGHPTRRSEDSVPVDGSPSADSFAAMRGSISDLLTRSEPGSKTAQLLRGMRVLVEVEAIAPGYLADRRREADGWMYKLSVARGKPGGLARDLGMREFGITRPAMEKELGLAMAVEVIAGNCGMEVLHLLLTPGNRLKEDDIRSLGAAGPERQVYAMDEAAKGRKPLARPSEVVSLMDTRDFREVASRLSRALGNVEWVIADLPRMPAELRLSPWERTEILRHLEGIVSLSPQLLQQVVGRGTTPSARGGKAGGPPGASVGDDKPPRVKTFAQVRGLLDLAHYFVEKCLKDVPRLRPDVRPTPEQQAVIRAKLLSLVDRSGVLRHLVFGLRTPPRA